MTDNHDLGNIPPIVPDRDDVDTHRSNKERRGKILSVRAIMPRR